MKLATRMLMLALLAMACDDDDEIIDDVLDPEETFTVPLTTGEEVPVCDAAGASATGNATVIVNDDEDRVTVTNLTWSGLSGPSTMAHIHFGAPGVAGPVVLDLGTDPTSPVNATFTAADFPSPAPEGAPGTFDDFLDAMFDGDTYINVHTAACPSGEIRGQID
jgi:hypothetical protein